MENLIMNTKFIKMSIVVLLIAFSLFNFAVAQQHHRITNEDSKGIVKLINPSVCSSLLMMEIPTCLDVLDGYAYVLTDKSLNVVLVDPVTEINLISTTATCDKPSGVAVIANFAFVLSPDNKIQMFNISNRAKPILDNTLNVKKPTCFAVTDDILYVSSYDDEAGKDTITSINNRIPEELAVEEIFYIDGQILAFDCDSHGIYAICKMKSDSDDGLKLLDLNFESRKINVMGTIEGITAKVDSCMIDGNILYAVDSSFGIYAFDVEQNSPKLISKLKLNGTPCDIDINSDAAFVCCQSGGLIIVDISDPANMKINNKAVTPGKILDAVAGDKLVYSVDDYGVQIVKLLD